MIKHGLRAFTVSARGSVYDQRQKQLQQFIFQKETNKLKALLADDEVDLNAADPTTGHVPLHDAVLHGTPDVVDVLLSQGAFLYEKTSKGGDVLRLATGLQSPEMLEYLLTRGKYSYFPATHDMFARCMCMCILHKKPSHFALLWKHKGSFFEV